MGVTTGVVIGVTLLEVAFLVVVLFEPEKDVLVHEIKMIAPTSNEKNSVIFDMAFSFVLATVKLIYSNSFILLIGKMNEFL